MQYELSAAVLDKQVQALFELQTQIMKETFESMKKSPPLVLVTPGAVGMSFRDRPVYFTRDKVIIHLPLVACNLFEGRVFYLWQKTRQ